MPADDTRRDVPADARPDRPIEFTASRVGGAPPRALSVAVGCLIVTLVALAIVKPWVGEPAPDGASAAIAVASVAPPPTLPTPSSPSRPVGEVGPSLTVGGVVAVPPALPATVAAVQRLLARRTGSWGVGDGGSGPRLIRDDPWWDWAAVAPVSAATFPSSLIRWADTSLCSGAPTLLDRPSVVAVTSPLAVGLAWTHAGWWSDGVLITGIADELRILSVPSSPPLLSLERRDGQPWPDGRYELHLRAGGDALAVSFCIGHG
ncbi:MAG: hypothetical protein IVW53_00145 [Chloroflexi bacterium]|nr:hypothetical protein [Chloroflexota bacterium]